MKKLFSFRSHSSNNTNHNQQPTSSTEKPVYWEKPTEKVDKCNKSKQGSEDQVFASAPCLRRSLSSSSGYLYDHGKGPTNYSNRSGSPCSTSYNSNKQSGIYSSNSGAPTPEKRTRKRYDGGILSGNAQNKEKFDPVAVSRAHSDLSEVSNSSSNVSNKVLDRYIDGEQQMDKCESKTSFSRSNQFENRIAVVKRPPRLQFSAPVSDDARRHTPKSQSFITSKMSKLRLPSEDGTNGEYCNESPRMLAKHVVERLCQSQLPKMRSKDVEPDCPITIEEVYGRTSNRYSNPYVDQVSPKSSSADSRIDIDGSRQELLKKESRSGYKPGVGENVEIALDTDMELYTKFKEAENRAAILSEDLERGSYHRFRELSVPALIQTIRNLTEDKLNLALEVSSVLEDRIAEKAWFKEKLSLGKVELDDQTWRLDKERNELQLTLEKELDRRSTEWSLKLEKFQSEEHRLRERLRELAEQNVCLQREISSHSEWKKDAQTKITHSEKQVGDLSIQVREAREENSCLQGSLSAMQEKTREAEEERDCIRKNYEDKVSEVKGLHQSINRLQRICNEQEKTIDGLRGLCEELGKKISQESSEFGYEKMRIEHVRLTGVEHALRKELELYRGQVNSLRHENIDLLNRLKDHVGQDAFSTFKLDRELQSRINCLQNQMLPLLSESSQLGRKLLEYVKYNCGSSLQKGEASSHFLDGQVLVECEVKIQGLEHAAENLKMTVQTTSNVLKEKSAFLNDKSCLSNKPDKQNEQIPEFVCQDVIRSELKAETLLTNLLREKLYSSEQDMEQLQAELAAAVRGNDILRCEVQTAVDDFSCANHKMKEVELQMMKKDETINLLQGDLQECKKELAIVRGILPKVSEERDVMWEQVKQSTEKNMLLNSEISGLQKKIESLEEDIMVKEGQITILKDSMRKPFDLLASSDPAENLYWTTDNAHKLIK